MTLVNDPRHGIVTIFVRPCRHAVMSASRERRSGCSSAEVGRPAVRLRNCEATGEHAQNRIIFKQLLQSGAIGFMQIDAARVGGVNENIANLLLAAKFGVPVCPHAGGVGLCELVQHLSMFDFVAVSGSREGRVIEYVDHLHEHFAVPVVIEDGSYQAPLAPGSGAEMLAASIAAYTWTGSPEPMAAA